MRKEQLSGDDIFVVHDFLTADECRQFVRRSEAAGYGDAPINVGAGAHVVRKDVRNNDRVMLDDVPLARQLWDRVGPYVPTPRELGVLTWHAVGLNERFRFYRYAPGQRFDWHFDGSFTRDTGERSLVTFMVYLTDDFEGGATVFNLRQYGGVRIDDPILRVTPVAGMALLFRHDVLHTGAEVTRGTKYVVRTDVMYRAGRSR